MPENRVFSRFTSSRFRRIEFHVPITISKNLFDHGRVPHILTTMQLLADATDSATATPLECGRELLDVVPGVLRTIRVVMRGNRAAGLSVPQFRTLCFLSRYEGASLSAVAEHLDISLPAMSRMVNGLVVRGYVLRRASSGDRRQMALTLSAKGKAAMGGTRGAAERQLAVELEKLNPQQRAVICEAMSAMRELFHTDRLPGSK
jgi:DNA-binding MarR family transcriptional regulator